MWVRSRRVRLWAGLTGAALVLAGCGGSARSTPRLRISVRPATALVDAAPSVTITGLRAEETVRVTATTRRAENVWSAAATFRAGPRGTVDLARQAPTDHAYLGAASLGLLGVETPGRATTRVATGPIVTTFRARAGRRTATATLRQLLRSRA